MLNMQYTLALAVIEVMKFIGCVCLKLLLVCVPSDVFECKRAKRRHGVITHCVMFGRCSWVLNALLLDGAEQSSR